MKNREYKMLLKKLLKKGVLNPSTGKFTREYKFKTIDASASIISGRAVSKAEAWDMWRVKDGPSLVDMKEKVVQDMIKTDMDKIMKGVK